MLGVLGNLIIREAQKPGGKPPLFYETIRDIPFFNPKGIHIQSLLAAVVEPNHKDLITILDELGLLHYEDRILNIQACPFSFNLQVIPLLVEVKGLIKEGENLLADDLPPFMLPRAFPVHSDRLRANLRQITIKHAIHQPLYQELRL